jgi:DNA-binding PadR family transcriptional regulator
LERLTFVAWTKLRFPYILKIIDEMGKDTWLRDFELMIMLTLLRLGENAYGVTIARELKIHGGRDASLANTYATLERLEEKGYVSSELGDPTPERGGRAKRYFRVTAKGMVKVRETRRVLSRLSRGVPGLEGETA